MFIRKFDIRKIEIPLPSSMFPISDVSKLKKAKGVLIDPIESISALLIRNEVVGRKLKNFHFNYRESAHISDASTAMFWKEAEVQCHSKYGPNVYLLPLIFSADKTELTKMSKIHTEFITLHAVLLK